MLWTIIRRKKLKKIALTLMVAFITLATLEARIEIPQKQNKFYDDEGAPLYYQNQIYVKISESASLNPIKSDKAQGAFDKLGVASVDNLLRKYKASKINKAFRQRENLPQKIKERIQSDAEIPDLSRIFRVELVEGANSYAALRALNSNPNVEYAEYVPIDKPFDVPDDSLYSQEQHLPQMLAEETWSEFKGENSSETIIVGVSDTGTEWDHPDLFDNLWRNLGEDADGDGKVLEYDEENNKWIFDPDDENGIDDDGNGYVDDFIGWDFLENFDQDTQGNNPEDYNNHGTHVAGISAGATNNGKGIASISWNVKFLPTSHSSPQFNYLKRGYEGIVYLAEMGCHVINCSWGGGGYSQANAEAIEYANSLGSIVICAAGNDNSPETFYPAGYLGVVSVASVASNDKRAYYSNYGKNIDICAPGGDNRVDGGILSSIRNGKYKKFQGTSMASPAAAGVFALLKARFPHWGNDLIIRQILGNADDIDSLNPDYVNDLGMGRVNPYKALTENTPDIPKKLKLDLITVYADDSLANNNKAIEPGEKIRLGFLIRNFDQITTSNSVEFTLKSLDPDIDIIEDKHTQKIEADAFNELPSNFVIEIDSTSKSKYANLYLTVKSKDADITFGSQMEFKVPIAAGGVLVWEEYPEAPGYSGDFIRDFLEDQGVGVLYSNTYPISMVGFDAVFLSCGTLSSGMPFTRTNDWNAEKIIDYLRSGGKLYYESADGIGFDQAENEELLELLGLDSAKDGSDTKQPGSLVGKQGTITEGLQYQGLDIWQVRSIDKLYPGEGKAAFEEPGYATVAVQNEGSYGQKSFVFTYPVSALIDQAPLNTRYELVKRIMDFFGLPMEYTVARMSFEPNTGHALLSVDFQEISYTSIPITERRWDFQSDGEFDSDEKNTTHSYEEPGDYTINMEVENGITTQTAEGDAYVFDGESAMSYENYETVIVEDSTLNIDSAFTVEAWIYPKGRGRGNYGRIMDKRFINLFLNDNHSYRFRIYRDRSRTEVRTANETVKYNEWQHIAVAFDGDSTVKMFLNGVEQELNIINDQGSGLIRNNENQDLHIGNRWVYDQAFSGKIDEARLWDKARSSEEIQSSLFEELNGNEENLIAYWQFDEGNGATSADISGNNRECNVHALWRQGWRPGRIQKQPESKSSCEDDSVMFSVSVVETEENVNYQWYKDQEPLENGDRIIGADSIALLIKDLKFTDLGEYHFEVKNIGAGKSEYSEKANLTVIMKPTIELQPEEETALEYGSTLNLSLTADGGGELGYQWYKDGEEIEGANSDEYIKEDVSAADSGDYYCKVMNECGSVMSDTAYVYTALTVDDYAIYGFKAECAPNPFTDKTTIKLTVESKQSTKISLYDILGAFKADVHEGELRAGECIFEIDGQKLNLSKGAYLLVISGEGRKFTKLLIFY